MKLWWKVSLIAVTKNKLDMFGLQSWLNSSWTMHLKAMKSGWILQLFYWFPDIEFTIYFLHRETFQDMLVALDPTDTNPEVTIEDFQSALKFCINKLTSKTADSSFLFDISSINNNPQSQSTQHHSKLSSNHDSIKAIVQCLVISGWSFIIICNFFSFSWLKELILFRISMVGP